MVISATIDVHKFAPCITCHAWSPNLSMIAICPNNEEVHIYEKIEDKWKKIHTLQKHDQIVSGIDWSSKSNQIVTASHDRNAYVWIQEPTRWVPTLVILRLNRAALCVKWSPYENKFAVGSGAKIVSICYYEHESNWWVSKVIRKRHNSSVTGVAWHPNNILLATTSTDGKCRVFSTLIKGVDSKEIESKSSYTKFGEQVIQLDLSNTWTFGVKWSPSGNILAYSGHNSMIYFVNDVGPSHKAQSIAFRDLPLRDVLFVSESIVVGVGYDFSPMVFAANQSGSWKFVKFLEGKITTNSETKQESQVPQVFKNTHDQSRHNQDNDGMDSFRSQATAHENCINCIIPLKKLDESICKCFSTSGLDGKVVIWDVNNDEDISMHM